MRILNSILNFNTETKKKYWCLDAVSFVAVLIFFYCFAVFGFFYGLTLTFADADNIFSRSEAVCVSVCVYMVVFLWPACVRCCFCRCTEFSQRKEAVKGSWRGGAKERKHSSLSHLSPVCLWFRMCTWMNASCVVPVASLNRFVSQVPVANWHSPPPLTCLSTPL